MERWQARKQLSRDPAASTSLSVACRYASRPPSDPTLSPPIREPGQMTGFSCIWAPYFQAQYYRTAFWMVSGSSSSGKLEDVDATKLVTSPVTFSVLYLGIVALSGFGDVMVASG